MRPLLRPHPNTRLWNNPDGPEADAEYARISKIRKLMIGSPARTLAGLRAKAQVLKVMLRHDIETGKADPEDHVAWSLIKHIERADEAEQEAVRLDGRSRLRLRGAARHSARAGL